ncbi:MAG: hypothetical protein PHH83_01315 [Patescibacteria group bacterium]|nr:hypothetical protein [Patescibacteria group bacterium]
MSKMNVGVKINTKKDAWNFWDACNKVSHGVDWKTRIDENVSKNIIGKSRKESYKFLIPYLKNYYKENKDILVKLQNQTQNIFNEKADFLFEKMQKITKRKLYRKCFTCFLTTFPRCAYDYKSGYIWFYINLSAEKCTDVFLHELLHFQFIKYFRDKIDLDDRQFEFLKESLTVILNSEFNDLMYGEDRGYEIHQELRSKLSDYWTKTKDFDKLIDYGIKILPSCHSGLDPESITK